MVFAGEEHWDLVNPHNTSTQKATNYRQLRRRCKIFGANSLQKITIGMSEVPRKSNARTSQKCISISNKNQESHTSPRVMKWIIPGTTKDWSSSTNKVSWPKQGMKSPVVIMRTVRTTQGSSNLEPIMYSSAFRRQDYISTVLLTQSTLVLLSNSFVTMSGLEISLAWLHSKTVPTQINLGTGSERTSSLTCLSSRPPKIIHAKLLQVISC